MRSFGDNGQAPLPHHAYAAKSVFNAGVKDGLVKVNPWDIDNAARVVVLQTPKAVRATMVNEPGARGHPAAR